MSLVLSREAWADGSAHRWLEARRDERGVVALGEDRFAVISHRAAMEVLTDSRRFTSRFGTGPHHVEVPGASLNLSDPPLSTQLRRLLSLSRLAGEGRGVGARAAELLSSRPTELVTQFAQPLALSVFGRLFGVDDAATLEALGRLTRALPRAPDATAFARADAELLAFLRARPSLFRVELENERDRLYLQRLVAQTGHESTAMTIALSLELVLQRALKFEPTPGAVDELLRVTSVLIRFGREATAATTVNGLEVPAGARLLVFFPLVNRDPEVFSRPDELVLDRAPNPHLTFGAGSHACFGADVAREVLTVALRASFAMEPRPRSSSSTPLVSAVTRGLESLVVEY